MLRQSKIILIAFLALLANANQSNAQTEKFQSSTQVWGEMSTLGWVAPKLKWQADLQYARQSPYASLNLLQYEQQITGRFWLHYYHSISTRLSIFGGVWGNQAIDDNVDALPHDEQRAAIQLQLYRYPRQNLLLTFRFREEFRDLSDLNQNFGLGIRGRYQVRAHYYLKEHASKTTRYYLIGFNEIFFRHLKEAEGASFFDQNRIFVGVGCEFNPRVTFEIGYFNQFQKARFTPVYDINSAVQISLVFDQLTKLRK